MTSLKTPSLGTIFAWLRDREPEMVASLREIVRHQSPTRDKEACDALCHHLAREFVAIGGFPHVHKQTAAGDHLEVDFSARASDRKPVLLLGHYDTVHARGALEAMPWTERAGKLYGPGVFDMKAGITQMLFAVRALRENGGMPRPVKVWIVSDEEEGSATSRETTEALAKQCAAVLVCEPSGPGGALKTARKGVGAFTLKITGIAAHSGLDFEKGHSAILELAHQIQAIAALSNLERGITMNVGVIRGGTRTNVVAESATAEMDLRVSRAEDGAEMERRVGELRPVDPLCKLEITGGMNRPPMERTEQVAALFELACKIGHEFDMKLREISVGGGSDGNFTAGMGIPTLDGLGAVGDGAHAVHEHIVAAEMPKRAALLAGLIQAVE